MSHHLPRKFPPASADNVPPDQPRRYFGVENVEVHGLDLLQKSIAAGHGIMLTPNHCRDADPPLMGELVYRTGRGIYIMASWHLFHQSRIQTFMLRRAVAFSIYREGMDRTALNTAVVVIEK